MLMWFGTPSKRISKAFLRRELVEYRTDYSYEKEREEN